MLSLGCRLSPPGSAALKLDWCWGILDYTFITRNPHNSIGHCSGPYITSSACPGVSI